MAIRKTGVALGLYAACLTGCSQYAEVVPYDADKALTHATAPGTQQSPRPVGKSALNASTSEAIETPTRASETTPKKLVRVTACYDQTDITASHASSAPLGMKNGPACKQFFDDTLGPKDGSKPTLVDIERLPQCFEDVQKSLAPTCHMERDGIER